jgi:hypothetical protein
MRYESLTSQPTYDLNKTCVYDGFEHSHVQSNSGMPFPSYRATSTSDGNGQAKVRLLLPATRAFSTLCVGGYD